MSASSGQVAAEKLRAFSVLVVEDDASLAEVLIGQLSKLGVQVQSAASAHDAILKLRNQRFDCVVLDMQLEKGGKGDEVIDAIQSLKHNPLLPPIPVVVTSGTLNAYVIKGIRHNIQAAFVKPYDVEQVIGKVRQVLTGA